MLNLTYRNLKVFVRDRANVLFSLMGVFVVIGLYVFFLKNMITLDGIANTSFITDSWVMAGVIAVASMTTTLGAFAIMVEDRSNKIIKDFTAAPIKRWQLAGGYVFSSYIVGVIASILSLIFAEIFIVINGGELLSFIQFIKIFGIILITVLCSSSMVYFLVTFFRSNNAFSGLSTIVGVLSGFITGVYIPIGQFPEAVQWVIKLFPVSQGTALMRQVMTETPIKQALEKLPEVARSEFLTEFNNVMGVYFKYGDTTVTTWMHIAILLGSAAVFFILAVVNVSRKQK